MAIERKTEYIYLLVGKIPVLNLPIKEEAPGFSERQALSRLRLRLVIRYSENTIPSVEKLRGYLKITQIKARQKPLECTW